MFCSSNTAHANGRMRSELLGFRHDAEAKPEYRDSSRGAQWLQALAGE